MHLNARRLAAPKARRSAQSTVVAGAVPGRVVATPPLANAAPPQHRDDPNALRRESSRTASSSSSSTSNGNGSASVTGNGSLEGAGRVPARPTSRAGLTAKERLALLEEAQSKTARALRDVQYTPYQAGAAGLVDVRMYDAAVESQKRMSQKLSEANAYANYLERRVEESTQHLQELYDMLKKVGMEFGAVERMAEATAAAVRFGVDKNDSVDKVLKLCERLRTMDEAVSEQRRLFNSKVPKPVPVAWVGVANSVRLMGSFDQWTKGFELSVPDVDMSDGVYKTFEAQVPLRPGRYLVKFMVDNEWRLTGDWPTEQNELGESNNVLLVT